MVWWVEGEVEEATRILRVGQGGVLLGEFNYWGLVLGLGGIFVLGLGQLLATKFFLRHVSTIRVLEWQVMMKRTPLKPFYL